MKVRKIKEFTNSRDLCVTLKCDACGAKHLMLVPHNAWGEHEDGCPLADRTAYIDEWAYRRLCPSCGHEDTSDLNIMFCDCERIKESNRIWGLMRDAFIKHQSRFPGGMSGWLLADGELGILTHADADYDTEICANISQNEDAENNGMPLPEFYMEVMVRGKGEVHFRRIYTASLELSVNAEPSVYENAVAALIEKAEQFFVDGKPQKPAYEDLSESIVKVS